MKISTIETFSDEGHKYGELSTAGEISFIKMATVFTGILMILVFSIYYSLNTSHQRADFYYGPLDSSIEVKSTYYLAPIPVKNDVIPLSSKKFYRFNFTNATSYKDNVNLKFVSGVNAVVLMDHLTAQIPVRLRDKAKKYVEDILRFSEINNLDPLWVISIVWTESHFRPRVKSHVNAMGLMQIMPDTGKFINELLKRPTDKRLVMQLLKDPRTNIELGTFYLKRLLDRLGGHKYATIAYNMGPKFVTDRKKSNLPLGVKNNYLNKVDRHYKILSQAVIALEERAINEAKHNILIHKTQLFGNDYYLGLDLNMIPMPKYALKMNNFYPKRLVNQSHLL